MQMTQEKTAIDDLLRARMERCVHEEITSGTEPSKAVGVAIEDMTESLKQITAVLTRPLPNGVKLCN